MYDRQKDGSKTVRRKGPEKSATLYMVGTKKTGNDGNKWIIAETSKGIKRWQIYSKSKSKNKSKSKSKGKSKKKSRSKGKTKGKSKNKSKTKGNHKSKSKGKSKSKSKKKSICGGISKIQYMEKYKKCKKEQIEKYESMSNTGSFIERKDLASKSIEYLIHDNGGRPFKFIATKKGIDIFTYQDEEDFDYSQCSQKLVYNVHLLSIKKFIGFWIGIDTGNENCYFRLVADEFKGNSILIQETKFSYVSVGQSVYRFATDEKILDYMSPVGGSDVPYPIAYSEKNVYFILENKYVPIERLNTPATPINAEKMYSEFYGQSFPENNRKIKKSARIVRNKKILIERK
jgi:hypothetical protein